MGPENGQHVQDGAMTVTGYRFCTCGESFRTMPLMREHLMEHEKVRVGAAVAELRNEVAVVDDDTIACDGHEEFRPAVASLVMLDSSSAANCVFACTECLVGTLTAWANCADDGDDTEGWEIRRVE